MQRPSEHEYTSYTAYCRALEEYCTQLEQKSAKDNAALKHIMLDAERYRTLMHHCKEKRIWYHVLEEDQRALDNSVDSVLDALSAKDKEQA